MRVWKTCPRPKSLFWKSAGVVWKVHVLVCRSCASSDENGEQREEQASIRGKVYFKRQLLPKVGTAKLGSIAYSITLANHRRQRDKEMWARSSKDKQAKRNHCKHINVKSEGRKWACATNHRLRGALSLSCSTFGDHRERGQPTITFCRWVFLCKQLTSWLIQCMHQGASIDRARQGECRHAMRERGDKKNIIGGRATHAWRLPCPFLQV